MKKMKTNRIIILTVLACIALSACEGMMDFHQKYIEGGEIVYLPPPLSTEFLAGKDRVVVKMAFHNSPNTKSVDVYWNNGRDSLITPVTLSAGADTVYVSVPVSDAKGYNFTVYSTDAYGNRSLPVVGFGTAYGALYQSALENQPVRRVALGEDGGLVQWSLKAEGLLGNEVRYPTRGGDTLTVKTPADVNTLLPDIKTASKMTYRSSFLPEPTAVDTFYTAWRTYETPFPEIVLLDKTKMTAHSCSSEAVSDGGGMQSILNDNPATYWHTWYSTPPPFPHWIIIDMGKSRSNIVKIEIFRRLGFTDIKTVEFSVGDVPSYTTGSWQTIGSVVFTNNGSPEYDGEVLTIAQGTDTSGRYLLIVLPDDTGRGGNLHYNSLSRLDIYTD